MYKNDGISLAKSDQNLEYDIQKELKRTFNKHLTNRFLNELEINNPDVKNSMISLFIPESQKGFTVRKR
jgi:hypothetical protein